jgi:predicted aspartyl protease
MGTFTVAMGLPDGTDLSALVDTGATFSKLPAKVLRRLGVRPDFATTVELGDGRLIRRRVGYVRLSLGRKQAPVPVMFGGSREEALVGATTLEILGLAPDPVRRRLVESRHLEVSERRARPARR